MFRDRGQKRGFIIFIQLVLNNQSAADPCHPVSTQKTQRRPWLFVPTARVVCSVLARLSWRAGARAEAFHRISAPERSGGTSAELLQRWWPGAPGATCYVGGRGELKLW